MKRFIAGLMNVPESDIEVSGPDIYGLVTVEIKWERFALIIDRSSDRWYMLHRPLYIRQPQTGMFEYNHKGTSTHSNMELNTVNLQTVRDAVSKLKEDRGKVMDIKPTRYSPLAAYFLNKEKLWRL